MNKSDGQTFFKDSAPVAVWKNFEKTDNRYFLTGVEIVYTKPDQTLWLESENVWGYYEVVKLHKKLYFDTYLGYK